MMMADEETTVDAHEAPKLAGITEEVASVLRHDLRNKLAVIRNAAFYIRRRLAGTEAWRADPRLEELSGVIQTEATRANELINERLGLRRSGPIAVPPASGGEPGAMTSVLLIDDDDGNRLTLSALLEGEGFDVREARSFAEARKLLSEPPPFALVLADQHLGDGLGSELLPLVHSRLPHAKTVLMSGSADDTPSSATWDGSFAKGDDFAELLQMIHGLCDVAHVEDRLLGD